METKFKLNLIEFISVIFFIAVIVTTGLWIANRIENRLKGDLGDSIGIIVNSTSNAIERWSSRKVADVQLLSKQQEVNFAANSFLLNHPTTITQIDFIQLANFKSILKEWLIENKDDDVYIIASDSTVVATTNDSLVGTKSSLFANTGGYSYVEIITKKIFVINIKTLDSSDASKGYIHFFVAPILRSDNNSIIGLLAIKTNLKKNITPFIETSRIGRTDETYAFNKSGYMITDSRWSGRFLSSQFVSSDSSYSILLSYPGANGKLTEMAENAIEGKSGLNMNGYRNYRGAFVFGGWSWNNQLQIGVTCEIVAYEGTKTIKEMKFFILIFCCAIILLTWILYMTIVGLKIRSFKKLQDAHNQLEIIVATRTSELKKISRAIEQSPSAVIITDLDGNIEYVNPRLPKLTGYSIPEVMGKNPRIFKSNYTPKNVYTDLWETILTGKEWRGEFYNKKKDGEFYWVTASISSIKDQKSKITHFVCVEEEFTERKKAVDALKDSELRYRELVESASDMIYRADRAGKFTFANHIALRITGFNEEEIMVKKYTDLVAPHFRTVVQRFYNRQIRSNKQDSYFEFPILTKDGTELWIGQKLRLLWNNNKIIGVQAVARDISERKLIEDRLAENQQRLAENQQRLTEIIDTVGEGLTFSDLNGKFEIFNPMMEVITGYTMDEANQFDDFWNELYQNPEEQKKIKDGIEELLKIKEILEVETTIHTKDGVEKTLLISSSLVKIKYQTMILSIYRDITERKQIERELHTAREEADAANKAKSDFLARMSHELRTPLNGILGYAQILQRDKTISDSQRNGVEIIKNSGEHLLELINDILDLSKIEAQQLELFSDSFDLKGMLKNIVDIVKIKAEQKNLAFEMKLNAGVPKYVIGDSRAIKQVLINLLGNAIKFTNEGKIVFIIEYIYERLKVSIVDSGIGIPPNKIKEIFEPFKQVGGKSSKIEGTGLGLSITKRLVELMNGTLSVTSELGKGSVFVLDVPLPEIELIDAVQAQVSYDITGYEGNKKLVLIADDNTGNILLLRTVIEPLGFDIITATDGEEALIQTFENNPDLLLLDIVMPKLDGYEVAKQIRTTTGFESLPIIAISASVLVVDQNLCFEAGCSDFITKPFKIENLLDKIKLNLGVKWIYKENSDPVILQQKNISKESEPEKFASEVKIPERDVLLKLYDAGDMGNYTEIERITKVLLEDDQGFAPFVNHLKLFISKYDDAGILDFLGKYIK